MREDLPKPREWTSDDIFETLEDGVKMLRDIPNFNGLPEQDQGSALKWVWGILTMPVISGKVWTESFLWNLLENETILNPKVPYLQKVAYGILLPMINFDRDSVWESWAETSPTGNLEDWYTILGYSNTEQNPIAKPMKSIRDFVAQLSAFVNTGEDNVGGYFQNKVLLKEAMRCFAQVRDNFEKVQVAVFNTARAAERAVWKELFSGEMLLSKYVGPNATCIDRFLREVEEIKASGDYAVVAAFPEPRVSDPDLVGSPRDSPVLRPDSPDRSPSPPPPPPGPAVAVIRKDQPNNVVSLAVALTFLALAYSLRDD